MAKTPASKPAKKKAGTNIGQRYYELIDESDLSEAEKSVARIE